MYRKICDRIRQLLARQDTVLVAIDGSCTAGKTTLANRLAEEFDCNVFHMDDYFLQPHQRTPQRLAEPGGNVDYERFRQEVLLPLVHGDAVLCRPFDCQTRQLKAAVEMPVKRLTVIEGTYSCHPHFEGVHDLTVFLDLSPELRRQRILQRPQWKQKLFFEQWIPMEQTYFDTFQIKEHCSIVCSGEEL